MAGLKQVQNLANEAESTDFARVVAMACDSEKVFEAGFMIYLQGDLGVGKSFFSRAFIQTFLPGQKVKSPTYTMVESYNFSKVTIHHFDLYRLCDAEELEYLAVRDLLVNQYVALVEWPQKGGPFLPSADLQVTFEHQPVGRRASLEALSTRGERVVKQVMSVLSNK